MSRHVCEQNETLSNHKTEIALLKLQNNILDKELDNIKKTQATNTTLLITSLVSGILGLLGIIAIFIEFYLDK